MEDADEMLARVARAIYGAQVGEARELLASFSIDESGIADFARKLQSESETAQVLIFYSYLDDRIQSLLAQQMVRLESKSAREKLFGSNGPLGTSSSRMLVAYHLGWLSERTWERLSAFRKIRNEFAHRAFKVTFSDPAIAGHLKAIDYDVKAMIGSFVPVEFHDRLNNLLPRLLLLAHHTFRDLLVMPIATAHRVSPHDLAGDYDEQPENLRILARAVSAALCAACDLPLPENGSVDQV